MGLDAPNRLDVNQIKGSKMDLSKFSEIKEQVKDNEGLVSALTEIESQARALIDNKESAVGEVKKFKGVKHTMAELLGLDKDIPTDDLISKAGETLQTYQTKIDSLTKGASSKELEAANATEQLADLTGKMNEITSKWEQAEAKNKLGVLKDSFRSALTASNIKDPNAQDLAMNAHMSQIGEDTNLSDFAKTIAENNPYLTASVHKAGSGSNPSANNYNEGSSLRNTDPKDVKGRTAAIHARLEAQGIV